MAMVPLTHPHPQIKYKGEVPKSYYLHNQARVHYEHTVTVGVALPCSWRLRSCSHAACSGTNGGYSHPAGGYQWGLVPCRWQFVSAGVDFGLGVFPKTKKWK